MPWGKNLHAVQNRLINLEDQPLWLQSTRHSLPRWHGKRGSRQAGHDWPDEKEFGEPHGVTHLPVKQVCRLGTLFKPGPGPQCQTATMNKGSYFHLHPAYYRQLQFPACCGHDTIIQDRGLDDFNVLSTQLHLQNIQPEASAACCSLTGCTLGAI